MHKIMSNKIAREIATMNNEQLNQMITAIKYRRREIAREARSSLSAGDFVMVYGRTTFWKGRINQVKKTRCSVHNLDNGLDYSVPMVMIKKLPDRKVA